MGDNLTPDQRSRAMKAVKRRDTSAEVAIRRAMWAAGLRGWRVDVANLPGRPDIAFPRWKVAVFIDGGFWHGHPSRFPREGLRDYWIDKIRRNMDRDVRVNAELVAVGWVVLRIWDFEVRRDLHGSVRRIAEVIGSMAYASTGSGDSAGSGHW